MGLCPPSRCGCSFESDTLDIVRASDGTISLELPDAYAAAWPVFTFLNAAEMRATITSPQEGMEAWTRTDNRKHRYVEGDWRVTYQPATLFTPTLAGVTAGSGAVNNMQYWINDGELSFSYVLRLGSTPSVTGQLFVSVPVAAVAGATRLVFTCNAYDVSATTMYPMACELSGSLVPYVQSDNGSKTYPFTSTNPFTWAVGDEVWISGSYPTALSS